MEQKTLTKENIAETFNKISSTYDKTNSVLSFGLHKRWRKEGLKHFPPGKDFICIDLATGTCDQILAFAKDPRISTFLGYDISPDMLKIGQEKIDHHGLKGRVTLAIGDSLELPLREEGCHLITTSFGIRNVTDPVKCLSEMYRVLTNGGRALILEFSLPKWKIFRLPALFYLRYILPKIGALFSHNKQAYEYLDKTIETFPYGKAFLHLMNESGFEKVHTKKMCLGMVTLYVGEK